MCLPGLSECLMAVEASETLSLKLIFKFNLVLTFAQFDLLLQPDSVFLLGEEVA